jgi:NADPH:quinone reductase
VRVAEVVELTGPDAVRLGDRPGPGEGEVVVDVHAAGLSFPDLLRTRGEYQERAELPYVLGQEFAGTVATAAAGSGFSPGDRVAGKTHGVGAAAEQVAVAAHQLVALPERLSFEQGAAAIFNYETAIVALAIRGRVAAGETVLVHGAAGGTGTAAIQVAKGLGARTIAVVSTDEKAETARRAGADETVDLRGAWKDDALALTDGRGVDAVFDPVGGDLMIDTIRVLASGGRWVIVGFAGGSIPQIPANRLLLKNVDAVGSYVSGYLQHGSAGADELRRRLLELLAAGAIDPVIGSVLPFERAAEGLRELAERRVQGKVVLRTAG